MAHRLAIGCFDGCTRSRGFCPSFVEDDIASICQGCLRWSRTKVRGSKTIRYRVSLNNKPCRPRHANFHLTFMSQWVSESFLREVNGVGPRVSVVRKLRYPTHLPLISGRRNRSIARANSEAEKWTLFWAGCCETLGTDTVLQKACHCCNGSSLVGTPL